MRPAQDWSAPSSPGPREKVTERLGEAGGRGGGAEMSSEREWEWRGFSGEEFPGFLATLSQAGHLTARSALLRALPSRLYSGCFSGLVLNRSCSHSSPSPTKIALVKNIAYLSGVLRYSSILYCAHQQKSFPF